MVARTARISVCQFIGENYGFMNLLEEVPSDEGHKGAKSRIRVDGVMNFISLLIMTNSAKLIVRSPIFFNLTLFFLLLALLDPTL